ncbi:hypothetical protein Unana1_07690 [Umbelopsis nana]
MLRLSRSWVRQLHSAAPQCKSRIRQPVPELLPAETLDSLASSLEQNALSRGDDDMLDMLEKDRPASVNLRKKAYDKLIDKLHTSYTVDQLQSYLRSRNLVTPKTKRALVDRIVSQAWGIESPEEREAGRKVVSEVVPSTKRELVLLVGDHGQFLKQVEAQTKSQDQSLLLKGRRKAVKEAKEILSNLPEPVEAVRRHVNPLPHRWEELQRIVPEIAKISHAFVSAEDDGMIRISAKTQEAVDTANRLLDVAISEVKLSKSTRSPDEADHTFIRKEAAGDEATLAFIPFYDPIAMPLTTLGSGWSRLQANSIGSVNNLGATQDSIINGEIVPEYSSGHTTSLAKLSDTFGLAFSDHKSENIDISASFGTVIFQNPFNAQNEPDYMHPPLSGTFSMIDLQKQYDWKQERQCFFPSHPPTGLTSTLTPLSLYPKRSVSLHFIDSDFWKASRPKALKRLVLEFDIDKTAHQLVPQRVELEKQRSAIDCLGLNLPDIRLCGRVYQPIIRNGHAVEVDKEYLDAVDAVRDQCQLIE